jgi:hypothetical protein
MEPGPTKINAVQQAMNKLVNTANLIRSHGLPVEHIVSLPWACGPPIGMKIGRVGVYDHLAWTAKIVCTLDEVRPFVSLIWNVRFEPICVAPPIPQGRAVARDGV